MIEAHTLTVIVDSQHIRIPLTAEITLLEYMAREGIVALSSPCGGNGLCGKCLVQIIKGEVSPVREDEKRLLTRDQLQAGMRLACRVSLDTKHNIIIKVVNHQQEAQVMACFSGIIQEEDSTIANYFQRTHVHGDNGNSEVYGCAVDIGTTTIVTYLVRLDHDKIMGHRSAINKQAVYGGDVISRIQYVQEHNDGLEILHATIVNQLDEMILDLAFSLQIDVKQISEIVIVGNSTMIHLLLESDPTNIAIAPFTPNFVEPKEILAKEIGFESVPFARLYVPGAVSAYVGSDIVCGLYVSQIMKPEKAILYIDIGTNGEIVLWDGQKFHSCSSAAGPAFEGASIYQGMAAVPGAIDRIWHDEKGNISYTTIGNKTAIGLCGSGIIDALACMLELGLVDETGALQYDHPLAQSHFHISNDNHHKAALVISDNVLFTGRDIREVQLAKAAIAAGSDILLSRAGISADSLEAIFIAGGFGANIDILHAQRIGLLPYVPSNRFVALGNAAGKGALALLLFPEKKALVDEIRRSISYVELSGSMEFQERYIEHMLFN